MGLWRDIQKGVGKVFRNADPDVREAKAAVKDFLTVANKRHDELNTTISGLQEIAEVGKHIGKDTDMLIAKAKTSMPVEPKAFQNTPLDQRYSFFQAKLAREEGLKTEFVSLKNDDQSGFASLYSDAEAQMNNFQSSPTETLYREKQLAMLNALSKCEIYGNGDVADKLRQTADVKQSSIEVARKEVFSQDRTTSASLTQDDPQEILNNAIDGQNQNIEMTNVYLSELKAEFPVSTQGPADVTQPAVADRQTASPSM